MITNCKMRLPEEGRKELSTRVQKCCFAHGLEWEMNGRTVRKLDKGFWYLEEWIQFGDTVDYFENDELPEITPLDFLKKYEKGEEQSEYFKLDLSKCDPTERKRLREIIKKAIPHHGKWRIDTGNRVAQYRESGLCSRSVSGKEITWGYFFPMDGKKVVRVEETPSVRNELMLKRDDRPLSKGEQAYADSKVKPEPEQKTIRYIDERPMPYRMGWER